MNNNNNNKKQQSKGRAKRRAAVGLVTCFVAVVAITGVYTWSNYRERTKLEMEQTKEELEARKQAAKDLAEAANADAKKAQEEEEDTQDPATEEKVPFAGEETNTEENEQTDSSSAQTSGNTSQVNFTENSQLLWPVNGNVLMSFSMDKTVYFSTLDQYKYNPALILSGAVGDNVIAAAPGTVKSIDVLPQVGTTVTIDMGNGYECLYGQLKEVPVKVGDYVAASTVIGYLSEPTKYYSVEGCNLYFEMRKDGQPVNPMDYMAEE
ncbi:peptidoglycan DD-metalloendopeptidase family protein [Roseburia hominis]